MFAVGDVVGEGGIEILDIDAGSGLPDADEAVRFREWKGLEEDAVDDGEDGGVGTDAEGEGGYGGEGEERSAGEAAEGLIAIETQVRFLLNTENTDRAEIRSMNFRGVRVPS